MLVMRHDPRPSTARRACPGSPTDAVLAPPATHCLTARYGTVRYGTGQPDTARQPKVASEDRHGRWPGWPTSPVLSVPSECWSGYYQERGCWPYPVGLKLSL